MTRYDPYCDFMRRVWGSYTVQDLDLSGSLAARNGQLYGYGYTNSDSSVAFGPVAEASAGPGYGAHFPPNIGDAVAVLAFTDSHPEDRNLPVAIGFTRKTGDLLPLADDNGTTFTAMQKTGAWGIVPWFKAGRILWDKTKGLVLGGAKAGTQMAFDLLGSITMKFVSGQTFTIQQADGSTVKLTATNAGWEFMGPAVFDSAVTFKSTITVQGAATFQSTATFMGATTFMGASSFVGNVTMAGNLTVAGTTTLTPPYAPA